MLIPEKTILKIKELETVYEKRIFRTVTELETAYFETDNVFRQPPEDVSLYTPCPKNTRWGHNRGSAWFATQIRIPTEFRNLPLWLNAPAAGCEALLFVNGEPRGIFNATEFRNARGVHDTLRVYTPGRDPELLNIHLEAYAGHRVGGAMPLDTYETSDTYPNPENHRFGGLFLQERREDVKDFVFDLATLRTLFEALPEENFRKGALARAFQKIFTLIPRLPDDCAEESEWRPLLAEARILMQPLLECRNGDSAPFAGLVGHSHMDTAWLWTIDETIRKCARTYSNVLELMREYPDYLFAQSSALHADFMRQHYPQIFEGMKERNRQGRWELLGNSWVEPDCSIPAGESLIRQFLRGRRFAKECFNDAESPVYWLPDTFGYSAALPQILLGCGMKYFLTTKLTWNETNSFPYDTFLWRGIDGSRVLTHFNDIHCSTDPGTLIRKLSGGGRDFRTAKNYIQHKDVNSSRLISYGHGDGGGGPGYDMLEFARRVHDLEGAPKAEHISVADFMQRLEKEVPAPPVYSGELYLEMHRGTLTMGHDLKHNNRTLELALRDAEILAAITGVKPEETFQTLASHWDTLLLNQFHDILPGTSLPEVTDRAHKEMENAIAEVETFITSTIDGKENGESALTLFNTLSWERSGQIEIPDFPQGMIPADSSIKIQKRSDGTTVLGDCAIPPLSAQTLPLKQGTCTSDSTPFVFSARNKTLSTPFFQIRFDDAGGICSLTDKETQCELCRPEGLPLNSILCGEDAPYQWDNWDIDADLKLKLKRETRLLKFEVTDNGPLCFILHMELAIGRASKLIQHLCFRNDTPRIDFESELHWNEKHHFLKTAFELNLNCAVSRSEIQFGHITRPVHANFSEDRARFEVSQHKWSDLSENRRGAALLNDCKYGISIDGNGMYLSLCKSGGHPDPRGDNGVHRFRYALLPHNEGFRAENTVRAAYEFNLPPRIGKGAFERPPLCTLSAPGIIVETVKPAENGNGTILRLYECECSAARTTLAFERECSVDEICMLEKNVWKNHGRGKTFTLSFRPFEIKTIRFSD